MAETNWPIRVLRALIVDADSASVADLEDQFAQLGWEVRALKDCDSVVDAMRRDEFHLVLLDLRDGDAGIARLERIRSVDKQVCVIAMSGSASVDMAVSAMRHSAFHFLQKPIDHEELVHVVSEAVRANGLCVTLEQDLNCVIGRRLRERRIHESLTLREVAKQTGLSVSLISQVELGKSAASIATLHKLAAALKVPMSHFVETL